MSSSILKPVLLTVNITLVAAIVGFSTLLVFSKDDKNDATIKTINDQELLDPNIQKGAGDSRDHNAMRTLFKYNFTNYLKDNSVEIAPTVEQPVEATKPKVTPLGTLVILTGLTRSNETSASCILMTKGRKQHLIEIGEVIPDIFPEATFIKCPKYNQAVFLYNEEEVMLEFNLDPVGLVKPYEDQFSPHGNDPDNGDAVAGSEGNTNPNLTDPIIASNNNDFNSKESSFDELTNTWFIAEDELLFVEMNMEQMKKKVSFVHYLEDGEVKGIRLAKIDNDSLPYKRGFRKKDAIISVNGKRVSSSNELYALQNDPDIQNADKITVVFVRGGREQTMTFQAK